MSIRLHATAFVESAMAIAMRRVLGTGQKCVGWFDSAGAEFWAESPDFGRVGTATASRITPAGLAEFKDDAHTKLVVKAQAEGDAIRDVIVIPKVIAATDPTFAVRSADVTAAASAHALTDWDAFIRVVDDSASTVGDGGYSGKSTDEFSGYVQSVFAWRLQRLGVKHPRGRTHFTKEIVDGNITEKGCWKPAASRPDEVVDVADQDTEFQAAMERNKLAIVNGGANAKKKRSAVFWNEQTRDELRTSLGQMRTKGQPTYTDPQIERAVNVSLSMAGCLKVLEHAQIRDDLRETLGQMRSEGLHAYTDFQIELAVNVSLTIDECLEALKAAGPAPKFHRPEPRY